MKDYVYWNQNPDELYHYGRKGMKWYQNIFTDVPINKVRKRHAIGNLRKQHAYYKSTASELAKKQIREQSMSKEDAKRELQKNNAKLKMAYERQKKLINKNTAAAEYERIDKYMDKHAPGELDKMYANNAASNASVFAAGSWFGLAGGIPAAVIVSMVDRASLNKRTAERISKKKVSEVQKELDAYIKDTINLKIPDEYRVK